MRIATLGLLAVLASATTVTAADLDYGYLRGADDGYAPAPVIDWSGFYIGGHGGYSSAAMGYTNVFQPGLASYFRSSMVEKEFAVSSLLALPSRRQEGGSFGVFAGYNVQFDDIVIGIETDYTSATLAATSETKEVSRIYELSNGTTGGVSFSGESYTKLRDYGTVRGRAGYAFGSVLPFVTAGVAVGRANYIDRAYDLTRTIDGNPALIVENVKTKTVGGVALGAGIDFAVTSNILLRGEYQYVLFDDFDKHKININTVRGAAAVKF